MDFQGRYKVLEMLKDGEARTFKALQASSGRTVLLHQLWVERTPPNQPDLASMIFSFLRHATADEMKILIDMGEEGGRVFVVTEDQPVFQDLRKWLQSTARTREPAGKPGASKAQTGGVSGASGGKAENALTTQANPEGLVSSDAATEVFTPPKLGKPPVTPSPPTNQKEELGEFTKVFFSKDAPKTQPVRAVPPPAGKPSVPSAPNEGKPLERRPPTGFGAAPEPSKTQRRGPTPPAVEETLPPSPPAPEPSARAPGEFTRVFFGGVESKAAPSSPAPAAEPTRQAPAAPGQPAQPQGPGEFTLLFQAPQIKEKPSAAPSLEAKPSPPLTPPVKPFEQADPGEFTQLFHGGPGAAHAAEPPLAPSSPQPAMPLSGSPARQTPGELTQLIQGYQVGKAADGPGPFEQPGSAAPLPAPKAEEPRAGEFTKIFQRPSDLASPPPAAPAPRMGQTPPAAPQPVEPGEYTRMFELPSGAGAAQGQGVRQGPPPPAAGRVAPGIPGVSVTPPVAPNLPYVQPPVVSLPPVPQPQPYQVPTPQFQPPAVQSPYVSVPQPVMPSVPPLAVPLPSGPQAGPPQTGKGKFLVPLLILGGLFVIAVVVILVFALKH